MLDFTWPILGAIVAGGLIGFEREWRGRPAGFRTHILVSLASMLLMYASVTQGDWRFTVLPGQEIIADPARMAHGVLTGIGFLCAGVIFRTGFSIHGLTTAASLWITAALGILFGAGLYELAVAGTAATLAILIGLRVISRGLPAQILTDVTINWSAQGPRADIAALEVLERHDPNVRSDAHTLTDRGRMRSRTFRMRATEAELAQVSDELAAIDGLTGFELDPRDD